MAANLALCPYCDTRPRNSDDHIFPGFLGGKTTIRACKPCNDMFGHGFEGPASNDLAPVIVMLRRGGLHSPRRAVWKHAIKKEGLDYDLDSDLQLTPSAPVIERDDTGSIKRTVFANLRAARSFIRSQKALGRNLKFTPNTREGIDMRNFQFSLRIGVEVRRLAIKLAVAVADRLGFSSGLVNKETRDFLLGNAEKSDRVRIDFVWHEQIEKMRPPLSHFVFVKGNGTTHNAYAIVQFYGMVQLYAYLNEGGFMGNDFAVAGSLDLAKGYREHFQPADLLMLPVAPVTINREEGQRLQSEWMKKWNAEAQAVLQDGASIASFSLSNS